MASRMRYIIGGALVLGIAAGVWLGDLFQGIGTGDGIGIGQSGVTGVQTSVETQPGPDLGLSTEASGIESIETIQVVVRDRTYFVRLNGEESPIDLPALLSMIAETTGNDEGIRVAIYRAGSARTTTVLQLTEALQNAGISDAAIYTSPEMVE
ncbi:hypothetical protein GC163_02435 [bacterium]|nr:hypothetical protein [bacterium]